MAIDRPPRNVRLLATFNFAQDFRPDSPIAIVYFSALTGSFALGMSVLSMVMLAAAIGEVPTGVFSDRIGRKRTIVCGALFGIAAAICYALAGYVGGAAYAVLLTGAACEGIARSFYSGNNDALLYDSLADSGRIDEFQEWLGRTASMFQFALMLSALVGSLVLLAADFRAVMWVAVLPQIACLGIALSFDATRAHRHTTGNVYAHTWEAFRAIIRSPRLRTLSAASILNFGFGESGFMFRPAFVASLWPSWAISLARMGSNAGGALSFYFAGRVLKRGRALTREPEFPIVMFSVVGMGLINLVALGFPGVLSPLVIASTSLMFGVTMVALGGLMQREFTDEQRATMGSITSLGGSLTYAILGVVLGLLADRVGVIPALIIYQVLNIVLAGGLYWRAFRRTSARAAQSAVA